MQSTAVRVLVAVAAVAIIVIGFVFLGEDEAKTPTDAAVPEKAETTTKDETTPAIVVADGGAVDGVAELTYTKGDTIDFTVESDAAGEVHVHGYDVEQEVDAGGRTHFEFPADIEGIFEVELHGTEAQIAELTVNP